jgi:hypothetical protein
MKQNSSIELNITNNSTNLNGLNLVYKIHAVVLLLIIIFSLIGNLLSFIIYRQKIFKKQSIGLYLSILSLLNLYIVLNPLENLHSYGIQFTWMKNDYYCKLFTLLRYINFQYCSWILVLNSIDHILTIQLRNAFLKKRPNQILALIFIFMCLCLVNIPLLMDSYYDQKYSLCTINPSKSYLIDVIDMVTSTLIPFIIMFLSTIIILVRLFRWKSDHTFARSENEIRRNQRKKQFARSIVCFNFLFLACNLPNSVVMIIYNYKVSIYSSSPTSVIGSESLDYKKLFLVHSIFITILYSYNASFLIVSLLSNKIFRQEFLRLFCNKSFNQPIFLYET